MVQLRITYYNTLQSATETYTFESDNIVIRDRNLESYIKTQGFFGLNSSDNLCPLSGDDTGLVCRFSRLISILCLKEPDSALPVVLESSDGLRLVTSIWSTSQVYTKLTDYFVFNFSH